MLYGQNLPWRLAIRSAYRPSIKSVCSCTRRYYSVTRWQRIDGVSCRPLRPASIVQRSVIPNLTATFSTSPLRLRDTSDDPKVPSSKDAPTQVGAGRPDNEHDIPDDSEGRNKAAEASSSPGSSSSTGPLDLRSSSASGSGSGDSGSDGGRKGRKPSAERALQKTTVPEIYPQVMAIPI